MTLKKTAFTAHIGRARTHIQQRTRIRLKPCPLSNTILFYRTSVLFPLNTQRSLPSSSILSDLQPSEHSDLLRYTAARHWDSTVTNTETQTKLGRVEFRFLSQRETGWGGVIRNPPLAYLTCKPLAIIPREYWQVVLRCGKKTLVRTSSLMRRRRVWLQVVIACF